MINGHEKVISYLLSCPTGRVCLCRGPRSVGHERDRPRCRTPRQSVGSRNTLAAGLNLYSGAASGTMQQYQGQVEMNECARIGRSRLSDSQVYVSSYMHVPGWIP